MNMQTDEAIAREAAKQLWQFGVDPYLHEKVVAVILAAITKAKAADTIYNQDESAAILDLCKRQGLTVKQLLRQALREYQATVLGPVDLGPKAPPEAADLGISQSELARSFNVSRQIIKNIFRRKSWTHLQ